MPYPVRFDVFGEQQDAHLWLAAKHLAIEVRRKKNETLVQTGERVNGLYFILRGKIRMDYCHIDGTEKAIWYIGEHSIVGETPYFLRSPCRTNLVCTVPTQALFFSRQTIDEVIIKKWPQLVQSLLVGLAAKIRLLNEHIFTLSFDSVSVRFCKYLSLYTRTLATGELVGHLPLPKHEIARLFGVHRVTLYKALKELEQRGIIETRSKTVIYITDKKQFFNYASGGTFAK